jgi:predicted nucleic acid-binding protein
VIHLDTSVFVDVLTGPKRSAPQLRMWIERGERILLSVLVLYEWLRGLRLQEEIEAQEALFPRDAAVPFGPREAILAADLYRTAPPARTGAGPRRGCLRWRMAPRLDPEPGGLPGHSGPHASLRLVRRFIPTWCIPSHPVAIEPPRVGA